ncbi:unnamed protein product [Cuscuta epithymum]|uniref:Uncharacterized protein n=1 Tax=Cuscuta epithymum TaxID=186058 RepID=A0AAV0GFP5_9ASTE|nr:unnamed protein product [Cuscuta epithymum]
MYDPSSKVKFIIPSKSMIPNASNNTASITNIMTRSIPTTKSIRYSTSNNHGSDTTVGEYTTPTSSRITSSKDSCTLTHPLLTQRINLTISLCIIQLKCTRDILQVNE